LWFPASFATQPKLPTFTFVARHRVERREDKASE
jgi:hypothetical protein